MQQFVSWGLEEAEVRAQILSKGAPLPPCPTASARTGPHSHCPHGVTGPLDCCWSLSYWVVLGTLSVVCTEVALEAFWAPGVLGIPRHPPNFLPPSPSCAPLPSPSPFITLSSSSTGGMVVTLRPVQALSTDFKGGIGGMLGPSPRYGEIHSAAEREWWVGGCSHPSSKEGADSDDTGSSPAESIQMEPYSNSDSVSSDEKEVGGHQGLHRISTGSTATVHRGG